MFADFERYIKEQITLTDEDIKLLHATAIERTMRRKDFLLHEGEVCRHKTFVSKGLLRSYRTGEHGSEHILHFSAENSWIADPDSYSNGTPSQNNIEALEHTEVVQWPKSSLKEVFTRIPVFKAFSERLVFKNIALIQQRVFSAISLSAEEKYDDFIQNYPDLFARVPLHMIASYLGVSRETLSRIRHAQIKR